MRPYYDYNANDSYPLILYLPAIILAAPVALVIVAYDFVCSLSSKKSL